MAPKGTPEPILAKLRTAVGEILQEKDTMQRMHVLGLEPGDTDGAALKKRISSDIARWSRVAKAAHIEPQ
jgi:tripartite-type tricarboxylate transporter receptor subunit TctC